MCGTQGHHSERSGGAYGSILLVPRHSHFTPEPGGCLKCSPRKNSTVGLLQLKVTCLPTHTVTRCEKYMMSVESGRAEPMEAVGMDAELGRLQAVAPAHARDLRSQHTGQRCSRVSQPLDLRVPVLCRCLDSGSSRQRVALLT